MSLHYLLHSNHKQCLVLSEAYREDCGAKSSSTPTWLPSGNSAWQSVGDWGCTVICPPNQKLDMRNIYWLDEQNVLLKKSYILHTTILCCLAELVPTTTLQIYLFAQSATTCSSALLPWIPNGIPLLHLLPLPTRPVKSSLITMLSSHHRFIHFTLVFLLFSWLTSHLWGITTNHTFSF